MVCSGPILPDTAAAMAQLSVGQPVHSAVCGRIRALSLSELPWLQFTSLLGTHSGTCSLQACPSQLPCLHLLLSLAA